MRPDDAQDLPPAVDIPRVAEGVSMHVAVPTAAAPAGSSTSAPSGSGSDAQIARLQAQLKQLQKQMKDLATDSTMDASAKDKRQKLLQTQMQVVMEQIAQIQKAAAEAAQAKAAARSAPPTAPTAPTTARAEEEPVGRRSPATSMLGALLDEVA
ncbi:hypothetical protein FUT87_14370 [Mitsuaria sp. TWR114]|nr:hypothetical protein FUT87_14370 [Mitsuaria sp. TWR114]